MGITSELRAFIDAMDGTRPYEAERLCKVADRIDARHDELRDFCERLERAVTDREDVTLWGVDYTALPLDADGVPIHIGDRVENGERVARIVLTDGSWEPSVYIEMLPNVLHEHFCHEIGHYHAPTVEDVLREFALAVCKDDALTIRKGVVEEFAKRLTLAGDAE